MKLKQIQLPYYKNNYKQFFLHTSALHLETNSIPLSPSMHLERNKLQMALTLKRLVNSSNLALSSRL